MWIYFSRNYTATRSGSIIRDVVCEKCRCPYHYELARTGIGRGTSPYLLDNDGAERRADDRAQRDLAKRLTGDHEPVPCPSCNWIQLEGVRTLRRARHRWMLLSAILPGFGFLIAAFFAFALSSDPTSDEGWWPWVVGGMVGTGTVAVGLVLIRYLLQRQYDPNHEFPHRPDPIPGVPPALFREDADSDGGARYVPARPDGLPVASEWLQVQLQRCVFPNRCCSCLAEDPEHWLDLPLEGTNHLPLPVCTDCRRSIHRWWWLWAGLAMIAVPVACLGITLVPFGDTVGRWIVYGVVTLFATIAVVAIVPHRKVMPYRMKTIDNTRMVVRLWFANPGYTKLLSDAYNAGATVVVKPPPLPETTWDL